MDAHTVKTLPSNASAKGSTPVPRHVLVMDDDELFLQGICSSLESDGHFSTTAAVSIAQARQLVGERMFDAYVFDVNLEDGDGRDLCMELRERGVAAPIILLTGLSEEQDTVDGLQSGATDYVTKPLRSSQVLIARLQAHMRQTESANDVSFEFGGFVFKPNKKVLINQTSDGKIRLTEKEVLLLSLLLRSRGRMVSREELLRRGWGYSKDINTHTLETHVYRLRQKITRSSPPGDVSARSLLQTESGGYRLNVR